MAFPVFNAIASSYERSQKSCGVNAGVLMDASLTNPASGDFADSLQSAYFAVGDVGNSTPTAAEVQSPLLGETLAVR